MSGRYAQASTVQSRYSKPLMQPPNRPPLESASPAPSDPAQGETAPTDAALAGFARGVLQAEAQAVASLRIEPAFTQAVRRIGQAVEAGGALVVSGLGKNGPVGQKLSATFASTGTPSHFLHPTEAVHGDLGRIRRGDVALLLSFSGSTEELVNLAALLRQDQLPTIALTGNRRSDLGQLCDLCLWLGSITEACPWNLAPTASTTAMMALGDALALSVCRLRGVSPEQFHRYHPGGNLGRQMMPVARAMRFTVGVNLPLFDQRVSLAEAYDRSERSAKDSGLRRAGAMLVVDDEGRLAGIFTDGDLRRLVAAGQLGDLSAPLGQVMTPRPRSLPAEAPLREAVRLIHAHRIDELPIVDAPGRPVGLIDVQDLLSLKVIDERPGPPTDGGSGP